jgi:hypothetical protein
MNRFLDADLKLVGNRALPTNLNREFIVLGQRSKTAKSTRQITAEAAACP